MIYEMSNVERKSACLWHFLEESSSMNDVLLRYTTASVHEEQNYAPLQGDCHPSIIASHVT